MPLYQEWYLVGLIILIGDFYQLLDKGQTVYLLVLNRMARLETRTEELDHMAS